MKISIDTDLFLDAESFHKEWRKTFGFPDYYGANMDAWIDCMSSLPSEKIEGAQSSVILPKNETLVIELLHAAEFKQRLNDLYDKLFDLAGFVNQRLKEQGEGRKIELLERA